MRSLFAYLRYLFQRVCCRYQLVLYAEAITEHSMQEAIDVIAHYYVNKELMVFLDRPTREDVRRALQRDFHEMGVADPFWMRSDGPNPVLVEAILRLLDRSDRPCED